MKYIVLELEGKNKTRKENKCRPWEFLCNESIWSKICDNQFHQLITAPQDKQFSHRPCISAVFQWKTFRFKKSADLSFQFYCVETYTYKCKIRASAVIFHNLNPKFSTTTTDLQTWSKNLDQMECLSDFKRKGKRGVGSLSKCIKHIWSKLHTSEGGGNQSKFLIKS